MILQIECVRHGEHLHYPSSIAEGRERCWSERFRRGHVSGPRPDHKLPPLPSPRSSHAKRRPVKPPVRPSSKCLFWHACGAAAGFQIRRLAPTDLLLVLLLFAGISDLFSSSTLPLLRCSASLTARDVRCQRSVACVLSFVIDAS